jgi:hypothetical protein
LKRKTPTARRARFSDQRRGVRQRDRTAVRRQLDPKQFPELADGNLQSLRIVLEDREGNKIVQPGEIALAFETIEIAAPTPTPKSSPQTQRRRLQNQKRKFRAATLRKWRKSGQGIFGKVRLQI